MQNTSRLKAMVNWILPDTSDLHFYGQVLFALLIVLYNLKSCKNSLVKIKGRDNPEGCVRQIIQSSLEEGDIPKSFTIFLNRENIFC